MDAKAKSHELSKFVSDYATTHKLTITKHLGRGNNGHAYLTQNMLVIKETEDPNEVLLAIKKRALGKSIPSANVYDIERKDDTFIILQEYLVTPKNLQDDAFSLDCLYRDEVMKANSRRTNPPSFSEFLLSTESLKDKIPRNASNAVNGIISLYKSINKIGPELMQKESPVFRLDARIDHVGYNNNLDLVFFDMRDGSIHRNEAMLAVDAVLPPQTPRTSQQKMYEEPFIQYSPIDPSQQMALKF